MFVDWFLFSCTTLSFFILVFPGVCIVFSNILRTAFSFLVCSVLFCFCLLSFNVLRFFFVFCLYSYSLVFSCLALCCIAFSMYFVLPFLFCPFCSVLFLLVTARYFLVWLLGLKAQQGMIAIHPLPQGLFFSPRRTQRATFWESGGACHTLCWGRTFGWGGWSLPAPAPSSTTLPPARWPAKASKAEIVETCPRLILVSSLFNTCRYNSDDVVWDI